MRISILSAHQLPRPWDDGAERSALRHALEQIELADRLGYHAVWALAEHFHEEQAHASAPEVFLAACATRTERIRLGLTNLAVAPQVQHPARVAEAVATLDVLSGGRVELGTSELWSGAALGGLGLARADKRAAWDEGLRAVARMLAERPFAGADGPHLSMPPRNVVPKPLQRPHPPLWAAGTRREVATVAAERGLGALSLAFLGPGDAEAFVDDYYTLLLGERCVPAGAAVNANVAVALPMMVHADEAEAIERGIDGAHFFSYALGHYEGFGEHQPGRTSLWEEFLARREDVGLARSVVRADGAPLGVRILDDGLASLRGAIGTPEQVRELVLRYADAGVDELVLCVQTGRTRHEHVCEALELFAAEVMPAVRAGEEARVAAKRERLGDAERRALARRPPAPAFDPEYVFDAKDEHRVVDVVKSTVVEAPGGGAAAANDERRGGTALQHFARRHRPRAWARSAARLRTTLEARGQLAFRRFVAASDDERLERTIGSAAGLRTIFTAMERRFVPQRAGGFAGDIQYDLRTGAGEVRSWTVSVEAASASARPGTSDDPKLTLVVAVADFARVAAGELDPVAAVLNGRLELRGDFAVALKLGEMFGLGAPGR